MFNMNKPSLAIIKPLPATPCSGFTPLHSTPKILIGKAGRVAPSLKGPSIHLMTIPKLARLL